MPSERNRDLKKLDALAYHRREWGEDVVSKYHDIRADRGDTAVSEVRRLHDWMFVPVTLWPFNLQDLLSDCLATIASGKQLDRQTRLLIGLIPEPPTESVCAVVAAHEHDVQAGRYEQLVTTSAKFNATEKALALSEEMLADWGRIKTEWKVERYRDHKGVIRRSLTGERNLHPSFSIEWKRKAARFQVVFDAFCHRWNLYGMILDEPLLMKLSVNLTPHGTMIFIPAYWSLDAKRDVRWGGVTDLHRARVSKRQGAVLAEGLDERRAMATKLKTLDQEAKSRGLRGDARHRFLCDGLGLDEGTDAKRLSRLRKEF